MDSFCMKDKEKNFLGIIVEFRGRENLQIQIKTMYISYTTIIQAQSSFLSS